MTTEVADPRGEHWIVRRSLIRGRGGRGWRWRWRGPIDSLMNIGELIQIGDLGSIPVIGPIFLAVGVAALVVFLAILLPFLTLALLEALVLGLVVLAALLAATLFGRPILIRAELDARADPSESETAPRTGPTMYLWAVRGWRDSAAVRDRVVAAIRQGRDLATVHDSLVSPLAQRDHRPV